MRQPKATWHAQWIWEQERTLVTRPSGICQFLGLRQEDHRFKGTERIQSQPGYLSKTLPLKSKWAGNAAQL